MVEAAEELQTAQPQDGMGWRGPSGYEKWIESKGLPVYHGDLVPVPTSSGSTCTRDTVKAVDAAEHLLSISSASA